MSQKKVKALLVPSNETGALDFVAACPALNDRENSFSLPDLQCLFVARRLRLAPAQAKIIAELAFARRAA